MKVAQFSALVARWIGFWRGLVPSALSKKPHDARDAQGADRRGALRAAADRGAGQRPAPQHCRGIHAERAGAQTRGGTREAAPRVEVEHQRVWRNEAYPVTCTCRFNPLLVVHDGNPKKKKTLCFWAPPQKKRDPNTAALIGGAREAG